MYGYLETTLQAECKPPKTYWDCYWERFAYYWGFDGDKKPKGDKFWDWSAWTHACMANFLLFGSGELEIPTTRRGIRAFCDEHYATWRSRIVVTRWEITPEIEDYNSNLDKIYAIYPVTYEDVLHYIENPSAQLMGGFSNVRQFYAWTAFIFSWAAHVTGEAFYFYKGEEYLKLFLNPPADIERDLLRTPASTDTKRMSEFADKVWNVVSTKYLTEIKPFLLKSSLRDVRLFAENDMKEDMIKFTVSLAVETKGIKKDEELDLAKIALVGGLILVGSRLVFR